MRILKVAIFSLLIFTVSPVFSQNFDLDRLKTKTGTVYRDIQIIDADKHGLLFRHAKGIAKVSFPFLSTNIRDMFEPVADVPEVTEIDIKDKGSTQPTSLPTDKGGITAKQAATTDVVLTVTVRRPVRQQASGVRAMHPTPCNWPKHWHQFHPAHYLTNPACRNVATQNLLQATGLLPRPCGGVFHHSAGPNGLRHW